MRNRIVSTLGVFLLALGVVHASEREIVLDFNFPRFDVAQDTYGSGDKFYEQGFELFSTGASGLIRFDPFVSPLLPNNGTPHFGAVYWSEPVIRAGDGRAFDLRRIDLAEYSGVLAGVFESVTIEGTYVGGGSVSETFDLEADWVTHEFSSEWSGLERVSIDCCLAFDNVVVTLTPVPEPATGMMLAFGCGCLLVPRLRRFIRRDRCLT